MTLPKHTVTIATRGSTLALWQAHHVQHLLLQECGLSSRLLVVKTTGDRIQNRFLHDIGGKGLFIREIEQALVEGEADIGVHSLKDLPACIDPTFALGAYLPRGASGDVLVVSDAHIAEKLSGFGAVGPKALQAAGAFTVGTGSLRRRNLLAQASPHIEVVPIRGNVDTRMKRLQEGAWQGLVVAAAALARLPPVSGLFTFLLDPDWFTPSACQGTLVIETLCESPIRAHLGALNDAVAQRGAEIERGVLARLGADCTLPVGIHYTGDLAGGFVSTCVLAPDGSESRTRHPVREPDTCEEIAETVLEKLCQHGLEKVYHQLGLAFPPCGK